MKYSNYNWRRLDFSKICRVEIWPILDVEATSNLDVKSTSNLDVELTSKIGQNFDVENRPYFDVELTSDSDVDSTSTFRRRFDVDWRSATSWSNFDVDSTSYRRQVHTGKRKVRNRLLSTSTFMTSYTDLLYLSLYSCYGLLWGVMVIKGVQWCGVVWWCVRWTFKELRWLWRNINLHLLSDLQNRFLSATAVVTSFTNFFYRFKYTFVMRCFGVLWCVKECDGV